MKYTKQDWIDGKVAIKGNTEKADKANRFFRSIYHETKRDCDFCIDELYIADNKNGYGVCWDCSLTTELPTCDIDDIIWDGIPEKVIRLKTEKEFTEEYGVGWWNIGIFYRFKRPKMDYLFGKVKSEVDIKGYKIEDWMLTDKPLPKEEETGDIELMIASSKRVAQANKNNYDYINPSHYKQSSIETIDMMVAIWGKEKVADYCTISAFKYRSRIGNKPDQPVERELEKIKWYENKAKELRQ